MNDLLVYCVSVDRPRIDWLVDTLEGEGFDVRVSSKRENSARRCVLAVWSQRGLSAGWMRRAAKDAARDRILVSAVLDRVEVPRGLRGRGLADISDWPAIPADRAIDALLESVAAVSRDETKPTRRIDPVNSLALALVVGVFVGVGYLLARDPGSAPEGDDVPVARPVARSIESAPGQPGVGGEPRIDASPEEDSRAMAMMALDQLSRASAEGDHVIELARRNANRAFELNPEEPRARFALGVIVMLVDLQQADGGQLIVTACGAGVPELETRCAAAAEMPEVVGLDVGQRLALIETLTRANRD